MADNRLTKKKTEKPFAYNWWKYALSAAVSAMLVSIVFAVTAYRPPAEKSRSAHALNGYIDTETFQRDFWPELQARKPGTGELTVLNINLTDSSNIYAPMRFRPMWRRSKRPVPDFAGRDAQNHGGRRAGSARWS